MTSKIFLKLLGIAMCYLMVFTFLSPAPLVVRADSYTATQNGDWNNSATWGGSSTPTASDAVTIPNGITVTIPNAVTVDRTQTTTVGGTLDNYGTMSNNNTLHITTGFTNHAILDNYGTITNDGTLTNNGTLTNDGTLDNNLTFANFGTFSNNGVATNDGTINNSGRINLDDNVASTFTNNGTINNANVFYLVCGASYSGNLLVDKPGRTNCDGAILVLPEHRTRMTNQTPTFTWEVVAGADAYRIRVYNETRSYNTTVLVNGGTTTTYTWQENLPVGKYFWRVRARNGTIPAWSNFSKRNTVFID